MYSGLCICVFLAVLSVSSFGQQTRGSHDGNPLPAELEQSLAEHQRHSRAPSAGPLKSLPRLSDGSALPEPCLVIVLRSHCSTGRFSVMGSRVQSIDPTHRINDRDYMGWMDFGRRSAEEYEYSS
ncbi:CCKN protein, partial [Aegithalos caudatus]|nr:CCKN protein [Aegithalos caudatus]